MESEQLTIRLQKKAGSTKSKAKSIYKKGTKKGIITASQSSTSGDWYKFKNYKIADSEIQYINTG